MGTPSVQKMLRAVRPLFSPPKNGYPEQVASGVLLNVEGKYFVLSAAHAFEPFSGEALFIGCGNGIPPHPLEGNLLHVGDPIDAAVLPLGSQVPDKIRESCLTPDDLDLAVPVDERFFHQVCGFRAKASRVDKTTARSKHEGYSSFEYGTHEYQLLGVQREYQVLLAFEERVDGRNVRMPKGMSGGAVFKLEGVPAHPTRPVDLASRAKLTAIFIGWRRPGPKTPRALMGTRVSVHWNLIEQSLLRPNVDCS